MYRTLKDCLENVSLATCLWACSVFAHSGEVSAQDVSATFTVPDGFHVQPAVLPGLTAYPMFMTFDGVGRMYIAESTGKDLSGKEMAAAPECLILRLEDRDGDGVYDHRTVFAESLSLPMGVLWHDGHLFVASPPEFVRFADSDDDGVADERTVLLEGWNVFNTASLHGPFLGPDGMLYLTHGRHGYDITTREGAHLEGLASRIWRCQTDGSGLERYAGGGFDNPVELIFTPSGAMLGTMTYFTDPKYGQRDALMHWVWGGVYPKPHESVAEFVRTGDLMPVMTKFSRIAPAGFLQYRGTAFGENYAGDLFSAQFNPHRIQRHRLFVEGATFRTEDSDFLTSTDPDFYPTDVLEDADGSLLISDTGAWYVDACPISRVAKPEVKGSIYRIVRDGAPAVEDGWGKSIDWNALSPARAVALLDDGRPRVRDRALEAVVARADAGVKALGEMVNSGNEHRGGALAISALWRIGGDGASAVLRKSAAKASPVLREAAARALGELGDKDSVQTLETLLVAGGAAERAQAAEALGKIGRKDSAGALLLASAKAVDRFEDHAITYALISIGETAPLVTALDDETVPWAVRRTAMVALDQLKAPELNAARAMPLLESPDGAARDAALWVASHHAEWAGDVLGVVAERLNSGLPTANEQSAFGAILSAYSGTAECAALMASLLGDDGADRRVRAYLLDVTNAAPLPQLPANWEGALGVCLEAKDAAVVSKALAVARERDIGAFDGPLGAMAADDTVDASLRLGALAVVSRRDDGAVERHLDFAIAQLAPGNEPGLRQRAAALVGAAALSPPAKTRLVTALGVDADPVSLLTMLSVAGGESDGALGTALVDALTSSAVAERLLTGAQLETALASFPAAVQGKAKTLRDGVMAREAGMVARFVALEPKLGTGDVGRGRSLFFSEKARCSTCHAIGEEGGTLGPDLTTIGVVRTGHDLLESVLFPSSSIVPEAIPYVVETDEEELSGIIGEETADAITLKVGADEVRRIPRSAIKVMRASTVSMMPEGLDATLSETELIDLISFLQSLNNEQWLLPGHHEGKAH